MNKNIIQCIAVEISGDVTEVGQTNKQGKIVLVSLWVVKRLSFTIHLHIIGIDRNTFMEIIRWQWMPQPIHNFYKHNANSRDWFNKKNLLAQKTKVVTHQIMITYRLGCLQTVKCSSPSSLYFQMLRTLSTFLTLSIRKENLPVIFITAAPRWTNEMLSIFVLHKLSNASLIQSWDFVASRQLHLKQVYNCKHLSNIPWSHGKIVGKSNFQIFTLSASLYRDIETHKCDLSEC